jgi:predicted nuclease with TOPRIM domain
MELYKIKSQYLELLYKIENGEIPEEAISDTLESLDGEFEDKINSIACFIKGLDGEISLLKTEADNLKQRAESKSKKADNLRRYIFEAMKSLDKSKIETAQNVISVKKNPPKVEVSENFITWANYERPQLVRIKSSFEPDKAAIKEALNKGEQIPYCQLVQEESLNIK